MCHCDKWDNIVICRIRMSGIWNCFNYIRSNFGVESRFKYLCGREKEDIEFIICLL